MPKISFNMPGISEQVVEAREGETLLAVAQRASIPLEHACGGMASCGTCHIRVKGNNPGLSPMSGDERSVLRFEKSANSESRLACQAKVLSHVSVEIVNINLRKAA